MIASIPHSGRYIPPYLRELYTDDHLKRLRNSDWYLRELYDFLPTLGVTVVEADFSRYTVDVNRSIKGRPLAGVYNHHAIYTKDTFGENILKDRQVRLHEDQRLNDFYHPYHRALGQAVDTVRRQFGRAYVLDLHSFCVGVDEDVCLGSRRHHRTAPTLHRVLDDAFRANDFTVTHNGPMSGGYITQHYGAMDGVEAIQIELKYARYLKEGTYDGDFIPVLDPHKANSVRYALKNALSDMISALDNNYVMPVKRERRLTL